MMLTRKYNTRILTDRLDHVAAKIYQVQEQKGLELRHMMHEN